MLEKEERTVFGSNPQQNATGRRKFFSYILNIYHISNSPFCSKLVTLNTED